MLEVTRSNVVPALEAEADTHLDLGTPLGKVANNISDKAFEIINRSLVDNDRWDIEEVGPTAASWASGRVVKAFTDAQYVRAIENLDQQSWLALASEANRMVKDAGKPLDTAVYLVARKLFPKSLRNGFSSGILFWLTKYEFLTPTCKFEAVDCNGLLPVHRVVGFLAQYYNPKDPNPSLNFAARRIHGDTKRMQQKQDAGPNRDMGYANFAEPTERDGAPNRGEGAASDLIRSTCDAYADYFDRYGTAKTVKKHTDKAYRSLKQSLEKLEEDEVITADLLDILLKEAERDYITALAGAASKIK